MQTKRMKVAWHERKLASQCRSSEFIITIHYRDIQTPFLPQNKRFTDHSILSYPDFQEMIYFQFHARTGQSCQVCRRATAVHKASSHGRLLHFRGECLHLFLWSLQHIFQKFLLPVSHFRIAFSDWWSLFPFQKTKDKIKKCKKSKLL